MWNNFWTLWICFNNNFNWRGQILSLIHWERIKLVPDVLLNFQLTLDRLILFFMQICLLKVVTFIDLSAPCSQLTAWKFQRTEQNILGPDITETIVTAPLNKPTFSKSSDRKLPIYDFQSQFSMSKIRVPNLSQFFFHWRISI